MSKKLIAIALVAFSLVLVNCKEKTTDDPEPTPEKTLNKSLITNKNWESTLVSFYLRSDGKYCDSDGIDEFGTWKWLNNSDSLEIVDLALGTEIWYVKYCTETEMSAKLGKNASYKIFTKK